MRERILQELRQIEEMEHVKIIMAVESGSRAGRFIKTRSGEPFGNEEIVAREGNGAEDTEFE